jgi:hypothetical protein
MQELVVAEPAEGTQHRSVDVTEEVAETNE